MRMMAFFTTHDETLHPPDSHDDRYTSEGHQIYNVETDGNLNIAIQTPQ